MPFNFPCPKCGKTILNVPESYAGQRGRCLSCNSLVTIPTMVITEVQPEPAAVTSSPPRIPKPNHSQRQPARPRAAAVAPAVSPQPSPAFPLLREDPQPEVDDFPPLLENPRPKSPQQQLQRGLIPRRYPFLRRYCGMLTGLSLICGGLIILTGIGIAISPLFGLAIPQLGASSGLLFVLIGFAIGLSGYTFLVIGMAGVELLRVVMDIEENTRKLLDRGEESADSE